MIGSPRAGGGAAPQASRVAAVRLTGPSTDPGPLVTVNACAREPTDTRLSRPVRRKTVGRGLRPWPIGAHGNEWVDARQAIRIGTSNDPRSTRLEPAGLTAPRPNRARQTGLAGFQDFCCEGSGLGLETGGATRAKRTGTASESLP